MDITQLKAQAYDAIRQIEMWQIKLKKINEQITQLESTKPPLEEKGQYGK